MLRSLLESVGNIDLCLLTPAGNSIRRIGFEMGSNK
jgi:hypothetical protein